MRFSVMVNYNNIQVKFDLGYDQAIFDRFMPLVLTKIPIICSFR